MRLSPLPLSRSSRRTQCPGGWLTIEFWQIPVVCRWIHYLAAHCCAVLPILSCSFWLSRSRLTTLLPSQRFLRHRETEGAAARDVQFCTWGQRSTQQLATQVWSKLGRASRSRAFPSILRSFSSQTAAHKPKFNPTPAHAAKRLEISLEMLASRVTRSKKRLGRDREETALVRMWARESSAAPSVVRGCVGGVHSRSFCRHPPS